jgi:hypothetical protein
MSSKTAERTRETKTVKSGARPFTGIEAWWDKVDGQQASLIVSGGMVVLVFIVFAIINLFMG